MISSGGYFWNGLWYTWACLRKGLGSLSRGNIKFQVVIAWGEGVNNYYLLTSTVLSNGYIISTTAHYEKTAIFPFY